MNKREIGKRLRQLRGEIPRETIAKAVGVTTTAIAMYENGNRIPARSNKNSTCPILWQVNREHIFRYKLSDMFTNTAP